MKGNFHVPFGKGLVSVMVLVYFHHSLHLGIHMVANLIFSDIYIFVVY